jgi:hypothetical protein
MYRGRPFLRSSLEFEPQGFSTMRSISRRRSVRSSWALISTLLAWVVPIYGRTPKWFRFSRVHLVR